GRPASQRRLVGGAGRDDFQGGLSGRFHTFRPARSSRAQPHPAACGFADWLVYRKTGPVVVATRDRRRTGRCSPLIMAADCRAPALNCCGGDVPELPEVETVVRDLRPHLAGRRLSVARVGDKALRRPWRSEWEAALRGRFIEQVRRRGKWIILDLHDESHL